ncbi:beta-eliminating lyase-related protein [Bacteriovoracaceae bacterium]|nr:beta-eliminating lyase-related protein [Bacteriovoracaceae bacterium]
MNFLSDNTSGTNQEILDYLNTINHSYSNAYGEDQTTAKANKLLSDFFEKEVQVYFVSSGTIANSLALAHQIDGYGTIITHPEEHIANDECGAPSFFANGAQIKTASEDLSKLTPDVILKMINRSTPHGIHNSIPQALCISQTTAFGTVYKPYELKAIGDICSKNSLAFHVDGARFSNALVSNINSPAELTWKQGVTSLALGGTKNGLIMGEAIVFFDKKLSDTFVRVHKRSGQLVSKMRFFSGQWIPYLQLEIWKKNATAANSMGKKLGQILAKSKHISVLTSTETNIIICKIPKLLSTFLTDNGVQFYPWKSSEQEAARFVTSFTTTNSDIENLNDLLSRFESYDP